MANYGFEKGICAANLTVAVLNLLKGTNRN
jgi:hypothetical protein